MMPSLNLNVYRIKTENLIQRYLHRTSGYFSTLEVVVATP